MKAMQDAVAERRLGVGDRVRPLADGLGFARQRRLLDLQPRGLDDPAVGGDAGCPAERTTRSPGTSSAAGTWRSIPSRTTWATGDGLLLEGGEGLLGLPLGQEADGGVQHDDDQDRDRLDVLPDREGDGRGGEQQEDDQVLELGGEDRQRRAAAELGEAVRPELPEPSGASASVNPRAGSLRSLAAASATVSVCQATASDDVS